MKITHTFATRFTKDQLIIGFPKSVSSVKFNSAKNILKYFLTE